MVFNKELSAARQAGAGARLPGRGEKAGVFGGGGAGGRQRFQAFRDAFAFSGQLGSLMKKG